MSEKSPLEVLRAEFQPTLPNVLQSLSSVTFSKGSKTKCFEEVQKLFPKTSSKSVVEGKVEGNREGKALKVGVVLSGGQAAGGHNVITGLFDGLKKLNEKSQLIGFLSGPSGIVENHVLELTREGIAPYRNQGGFDLIGSGRTKIETDEQLKASLETVSKHDLDGLIVIGGDDSNTNAAVLAEYFLNEGCKTVVVGVPKTIDGDLQNEHVAISFGFDTAARTYSEMIGNIERDALSAKKYWHFVRLMGRSASHITLECALATHPNVALIAEEVAEKKMTLKQITDQVAEVIQDRAEKGMTYGVVLVPEGLIEFIPEMKGLIEELNQLAGEGETLEVTEVIEELSASGKTAFMSIPEEIQKQLLLDRDPHGNVQVSKIETEKLLISAVRKKVKLSAISHFFGYEGRAGYPSNFDTHYCYALGHVAALLVDEKLTGYMAFVENLENSVEKWKVGGLPITMLMNMEMRKGKEKPVIQKALVDLKGPAFSYFAKNREKWAKEDHYRFPGPIQFFGEGEGEIPMIMQLKN